MQDRFRFRVWNKKNKEMIYNAEIAYDGMNYNTSWQIGKNTNDGWVDCFGYYLDYPEDYEIMQCTGLKDKNGKLIYEGDVLQQSQLPHKVVCEWYKDGFWLNGFMNGAKRELRNMHNWYEVIGNIYENKELLESEA